ncbi:MAG: hypothetical protein GXP18_07155 [Gammaproteobacteria bacterium]|nr:hypothetical protein [Gammaproteobacteria bacterium]
MAVAIVSAHSSATAMGANKYVSNKNRLLRVKQKRFKKGTLSIDTILFLLCRDKFDLMPAHCWPTGIRRMIPFIFFSFKPYRNGGNDDAHQVAAFRTPGQVPTLRYNTCHYLALPTVYTSSKASIFSYRMQH